MKSTKCYTLKYSDGYKIQIKEDVFIQTRLRPKHPAEIPGYVSLGTDGGLWIYEKYAYDGATGGINLDCMRAGILVHDALFQLMQEGQLDIAFFQQANEELRDIAISNGTPVWITNFFYFCVSKFGNAFATKKKKIYVV